MFIQIRQKKVSEMVKELADRIIPGVTLRQVIPLIGGTAIFCMMYFNLKSTTKQALEQSLQNNATLQVILNNQKEADRVNNVRLTGIELDQREFKIRLSILENSTKN